MKSLEDSAPLTRLRLGQRLLSEVAEMARDRKVEHLIHRVDGTIGERNSYGHDPRNIPG
jgi:hypothetical protein